MSTTQSDRCASRGAGSDDSISTSLAIVEEMLEVGSDGMIGPDYFAEMDAALRRLHVRIRAQHASAQLDATNQWVGQASPQFAEDFVRLRSEHPMLLGKLDRLIRATEAMADRPLEDKEVFVMRVRELIAIIRRHEAEEDRLFYLSIWRDTGGES